MGVPRRTLERRFARAVGRSILGEITRNRIEHAKRLLLETDLARCKVGTAAGFGSVKSFTRTFRQAVAALRNTFALFPGPPSRVVSASSSLRHIER
ncbi:MAG: helix-turn-helix domain-containing protein [Terriglobia bacterium]